MLGIGSMGDVQHEAFADDVRDEDQANLSNPEAAIAISAYGMNHNDTMI